MKHRIPRKVRAFTLVEVVVAMGLFVIIMVAVSQMFISVFKGYREARALQRDVENAQYAVNIMAKELRTSTVVSFGTVAGTQSNVKFFDYSQNKCLLYQFLLTAPTRYLRVNEIQLSSDMNSDGKIDSYECSKTAFIPTAFTTVTTGTVKGQFTVEKSRIPTDPSGAHAGKVTIAFTITEGTHTANLQTTVSLRDYNKSGIITTP